MDLLHGADLRRLLIATGIQCWLQAQGSGYIVNYMVSFLRDSGTSNVFPYIMGLNFVYYGGILTGHVFPDTFGRRPVIILSSAANAVFMIVIASVNTAVSPATAKSGATSVAFLFLWQLSSGVISPLIWIISTEAAPSRNRERVLSVALFVSFGVSLLITSVSPYLQDEGYGNLGARIVSVIRVTNPFASNNGTNKFPGFHLGRWIDLDSDLVVLHRPRNQGSDFGADGLPLLRRHSDEKVQRLPVPGGDIASCREGRAWAYHHRNYDF